MQEKEKSLGLREMTKKNSLKGAGTDLHLQTGHLLPRTGGFPDAQLIEDHWEGGNPDTVGGKCVHFQYGDHLQPQLGNWGEKSRCLHSWGQRRGPQGLGQLLKGL